MGKRGLAFIGSRLSASHFSSLSTSLSANLYLTFFYCPSCCLAYFFSCLSFFYYCYYCITTVNTTVFRIPVIALSPYRSQRSFVLLNPLPIRHSIPVHSLKTASFSQSIIQLVWSERRLSETKGLEPLKLFERLLNRLLLHFCLKVATTTLASVASFLLPSSTACKISW